MLYLKTVGLFLLLASTTLSFSQGNHPDTTLLNAQIEEVNKLLKQAQYPKALSLAMKYYKPHQNSNSNAMPLQQAELLMLLGIAEFRNAEYSAASSHLEQAMEFLQTNPANNKRPLLFKTAGHLAMAYYDQEKIRQANTFADRIIQQFSDPLEDIHLALIYEVKALYLSDFLLLDKAEKWYDQARRIREHFVSQDSAQLVISYLYTGNVLWAKGQFKEAFKVWQTAAKWADRYNANNHYKGLARYYLNQALASQEQYERANIYLDEALIFFNQAYEPSHPLLIGVLEAYAINYKKMGKIDDAIAKHQKIITLLGRNQNIPPLELGITYHNLGLIYSDQGAVEIANMYFQKAITILQVYSEARPSIRSMLYVAYNSVINQLLNTAKYDSALIGYQQLIREIEIALGEDSPYLTQVLNNLGLTYNALGKYGQATAQFDRGLSILQYKEEHPTPFADMISPIELQYMLWNRADNYFDQYQANGNQEFLWLAQRDFAASVAFLDEMRKGFRSEGTKIGFAAENKVVYERGIEVELLLYEKTKSQQHLHQAFIYAEKARSLILLEVFRKNQVTSFPSLPPDIQRQELEYAQQLTRAEKAYYFQLTRPLTDSTLLERRLLELNEKRETYYQFLDQLQQDEPKYFNLKFNPDVLTVDQVRHQFLADDVALVEYYLGDAQNYVFLVTKDTLILQPLATNFDPAAASIALLTNIRNYTVDSIRPYRAQLAEEFDSLAYGLYQNLLNPIADHLPTQLIIVPDGQLGVLPFGVLLTQPSRRAGAFAVHEYLIKKHQLSYSYAASLLGSSHTPKASKRGPLKWLGVAPDYLDTPINLSSELSEEETLYYAPLLKNKEEITTIQQLMKGTILLGTEATKEVFIAALPDHNIIHFSGHATKNGEDGEWAYLVFHNFSEQADEVLLFSKEIYGLSLENSLVFLSACETTLGNYLPGEGITSLARAFTYAGARGLVSSLWQVNDQSTAELMTQLYQYIQEPTTSPAAALWQAQLELINRGGDYGHPYHWASFIGIGDIGKALFP